MGLFVLILVSSLISFFVGYTFGKFKGAKDGIDYCFEQWEKESIDSLNKKKHLIRSINND